MDDGLDIFDTGETIAAISTPAGQAGRAIIRASGPEALSTVAGVFTPRAGGLTDMRGFTSVAGWVRAPGVALPGRAYVFRAPRSYTRQDVVELHVPGSPLVASMVLSALLAAGARSAGPGEFTRRAFLHGRIDLSRAEAVADVIAAATDAQLRAANVNAAGELSRRCRRWRDAIVEALAETEASIDLAEERLELLAPSALVARLTELAGDIERTLDESAVIVDAAETPRVALAGAANVGKSSLLNALSGLDRAIVSAVAGTTRDVLTAPMALADGQEVLLLDLAGLARADGPVAAAAESAGRQALATCDALLLVADATCLRADTLVAVRARRAGAPAIVLANKIDVVAASARTAALAGLARAMGLEVLGVSAITGEGLGDVRLRLGAMLTLNAQRSAGSCALHERQRQALRDAAGALACAVELAGPLESLADRAEILAVELRSALAHIGTISGEVVTDELLGRIFARFCVGK